MKTLAEIREICQSSDHGLAAFYCGGELFINDLDGKTLWNNYINLETAHELCSELELDLIEV